MAKRIITLTESDIMRMVKRAVLMERVGRSETVPGVKSAEEAAYHWAKAVLNGIESGKGPMNGIEPYNGVDYTTVDWKFTIFGPYESLAKRQNGPIEKGVGQEIHDQNYTTSEDEVLRNGDPDDPYRQELENRPNRLLVPREYDEFKTDVYMAFFNPTPENKAMSTSTLDGRAQDIAKATVAQGKEGKDVLNMIGKALWLFSIHYYRNYIKNQGGEVMSTAGNSSLSDPITNNKDRDNYTGGKIENPKVYTTDMEISNQEADSMTQMSRSEALERLRMHFAVLFKKVCEDIVQFFGGTSFDKRYGVRRDLIKPYMIHGAKFIRDNFYRIFNEDFLEQFTGDTKGGDEAILAAVKMNVATEISKDYNKAVDSGDYDAEIIQLFPKDYAKAQKGETPEKKTPEQVNKQLEYMWNVFAPSTRSKASDVNDRPIGRGEDITKAVNDELAETVNRVVRKHLKRLMESRLRRR